MNRPTPWLLIVALASGCLVVDDEFAGKPCASDFDCPTDYRCVPARADGGLACELWGQVQVVGEGGPDDAGAEDAGVPVRSYVEDVQPILQNYCLENCHEATNVSQQQFRLDYYAPSMPGLPDGAYAVRDLIKAQTYDTHLMPPPSSPQPSDQDRLVLAQWDLTGGLYSADGGSPPPSTDGGSPSDAGSHDAGVHDAGSGSDAGSSGISFASQVQPIFNAYCTGCHTGSSPAGGLNLSSNAYSNLVNHKCNCDAGTGVDRVTPSSATSSELWRVISPTVNRCGTQMPPSTALGTASPADVTTITGWINEGAPNN